jgi:O-antigen ligase
MRQLSDKDIRNIEMGIANHHYAKKFSLNARIYKFLWEYQSMKMGSGPGGSSLLQRFEYWEAASGIIGENFWFGVGTGDMDEAFSQQYEKMNTQLQPEFRHRSHNQFLAIFTAFGVFGLLWFAVSLFYPPFLLKAFRNFRYFTFFVIITLSMVFEDTLETQMGATLFAFFNTFLLFGYNDDPEKSIV